MTRAYDTQVEAFITNKGPLKLAWQENNFASNISEKNQRIFLFLVHLF